MKNERLTLIGGGNMAEAILRGILESGVAEPGSVTVCDISSERRETLSRRYAVSCTESSAQAIAASPMVLLAVKPDAGHRVDENRQHLADKAVVHRRGLDHDGDTRKAGRQRAPAARHAQYAGDGREDRFSAQTIRYATARQPMPI